MTAHKFAAIHENMQELSGIARTTSDQHKDISQARRTRDTTDFQKNYQWLVDHNPFSKTYKNL